MWLKQTEIWNTVEQSADKVSKIVFYFSCCRGTSFLNNILRKSILDTSCSSFCVGSQMRGHRLSRGCGFLSTYCPLIGSYLLGCLPVPARRSCCQEGATDSLVP
ncbi:hypothetical protein CEXT_142451 [Caerostris extrusa]|uniref:Uncharacterized protein n=1 Tax=Caerostris extrusa TaxID=172846 RepID=A0AAV4UL46_CAEEX|nr:hypothetical protein CEXT_142451 [Caerostris extrusa]